MDLYQATDIKIRKEDRAKADKILEQHDVDEITCSEGNDGDFRTVTYWIRPYLSEDIDDIVKDFRDNGIQVF